VAVGRLKLWLEVYVTRGGQGDKHAPLMALYSFHYTTLSNVITKMKPTETTNSYDFQLVTARNQQDAIQG
jgi:hypothetical protein